MRLITVIKATWEDKCQRVSTDTLTIIVMLSAIAVAVLALYGVFD